MPKRKIGAFEEVKKKYVRMALETMKYSSTAKSAGISVDTLRSWIKEYEIEIRDDMESEGIPLVNGEWSNGTYKEKYEQAMKLLGEKELEVMILREALKKKTP